MTASKSALLAALLGAAAPVWGGCAGGSRDPYVKTTKADRMCAKLDACRAYLAEIQERVRQAWTSSDATPGQRVVVALRIDGNGDPLEVRTVRADSPELARSCRSAIAYAAPFGPLPASLTFMNRNEITIELVYREPRSK